MHQIIHQRRKYRSNLGKLTIVNLYFKRKDPRSLPAGEEVLFIILFFVPADPSIQSPYINE